jgi:hopanoid biosynthesis associated protein HpnK
MLVARTDANVRQPLFTNPALEPNQSRSSGSGGHVIMVTVPSPSFRVVLNGDDFGRSSTINAAIIQAHRQGVLTSTSLMVGGDAVEEAIILARETPTLAVGLHLVVVDGPAVLPASEIPHVVDGEGQFPNDAWGLGLRYAFNREARQELAREIEAQFERFAATGLRLSHVDGHLHMHMHPVVLDLLLPLAAKYGAGGVRLPRDELWLGLRYNHHHAGVKLAWAIAFGLLARRSAGRLAPWGLATTDRVYGLMQTGHMDEAYVLQVLGRLNVPAAELYFHPDTAPRSEDVGPNPGDLATLLSPEVARVIDERRLCLAAYPDLTRSKKP